MNTPQYEALLKIRRWTAYAETSGTPQMRKDLRAAEKMLLALSEENKSLKISNQALRDGRRVGPPNDSVMVTGTPQQQAEAVCAAEFPVDVYRYPCGTITWRKRNGKAPSGTEFIGTYDDGCDWRRVCEDLEEVAKVAA